MKSVLGVVLIILLFVMLTGCSDEPQNIVETSHQTGSSQSFSYSESYTDLSKQFMGGQYIGVLRSEIMLLAETIYMESAEAIGFDNVSIYGICGNMTMAFEDNRSKSCTFGSKPYTDKNDFSVQLNTLNEKIAEALGVEVQDFITICNDQTLDEREVVFSGKGVLKAEYDAGAYKLTISAIGSNGEAIITVTQLLK